MNEEKLKKLKKVAERTIRILELIEQEELSASEIAIEVKCDRQLVEYYLKVLKDED